MSQRNGGERIFSPCVTNERPHIIHEELFPYQDGFYANMREFIENGGWIVFEGPVQSTCMTKIYVRECYKQIASMIITESKSRTLITGTSGIGKSFFLIYLLWRLVKEWKRVVISFRVL